MPTLLATRWIVALMIGSGACMPALGASATLSAADRDAALQAIMAAFEEQYVFPEMRPRIIARLKSAQRKGRYATDDPALFAESITADLREVSRDKHLSLVVDPAGYAAARAGDDADKNEQALWRRQALRSHHGLAEQRILGGNVRYLKIAGFEWVDDETGPAYDDAMRFLKGGDAAIIDLRGNGGGTHAAVRYLVSHFMRGDVLEMTFLAGSAVPEQSRTLEYLPAGRLQNLPLYVLIDGGTASAAEAFAYDVQQFKLGELVGARTVGAANNNKLLPIAPNFLLSVSFGRPAPCCQQRQLGRRWSRADRRRSFAAGITSRAFSCTETSEREAGCDRRESERLRLGGNCSRREPASRRGDARAIARFGRTLPDHSGGVS